MTKASSGGLDVKAELASLDEGVQSVREKLEEEAVKRDERIAASNRAIEDAHDAANHASGVAIFAAIVGTVAILAAVIGIGIGAIGTRSAHRAERALAASQANTQAARVGSCEQYNAHERAQADIEISESHDQIDLFVAASASRPGSDPVAIQRFVVDYNRQHDASIRSAHASAKRDCSLAGIDRFLRGIPQH